jgi:16S rRNA (cytosine967-C5)-methyltransferase
MAKEKLFKSYLVTAASLIRNYDGSIPFSDFLKKHFSQHKKFGSRDRKHVSHLCYCFYRLGHALGNVDVKERILIALFLCSQHRNELLEQLKPEWNEKADVQLDEKFLLLNRSFNITDIFPWQEQLSESIDATSFAQSHLVQPNLFLRIRPGKKKQVLNKLREHKIGFKECDDDCLALANTTKVESILELNKEAVVQDYSSQRIKDFLDFARNTKSNPSTSLRVWDCCAASGGKSILAVDLLQNVDLTVSDIRPSIIHNLKNRFKQAGIHNYKSKVIDLTEPVNNALPLAIGEGFDLIICDVPCSGSGTWGRTAEQLYFFKKEKIDHYSVIQKKIANNTIPHLFKNGFFLYITCSVFKKENEEVVEFIQKKFPLQLIRKEVLIGYDKKADTMFGALFRNAE